MQQNVKVYLDSFSLYSYSYSCSHFSQYYYYYLSIIACSKTVTGFTNSARKLVIVAEKNPNLSLVRL